MSFCTEPYGCVRGLGYLGDVFTVNPGDCGADAQQVTELLWQLRNANLPPTANVTIIPPAACYVASSDVALVEEVQGGAGLPQTGVVDDATLTALATAVNAVAPAGQPVTLSPTPVQMPPLDVTGKGGGAKAAAAGGGLLLALGLGWFLLKKGRH